MTQILASRPSGASFLSDDDYDCEDEVFDHQLARDTVAGGRVLPPTSSSYRRSQSVSLSISCCYGAAYCNRSCLFVCLWVCYHDNSKLRASILTKLGL